MTMANSNSKIVNDIVYHFGMIGSENPDTGWRKEFNLVSWNGEPPKFEVRAWSPDYSRCSKIGGLTEKELRQLYEMIPAAIRQAPTLKGGGNLK